MQSDRPRFLDREEELLWDKADGFQRSMLLRVSIARQQAEVLLSACAVKDAALQKIKEATTFDRQPTVPRLRGDEMYGLIDEALREDAGQKLLEKNEATDQLLRQLRNKLHDMGHRADHIHKPCDFCAMMCTIEEIRKA
jgi:hypothetical protein